MLKNLLSLSPQYQKISVFATGDNVPAYLTYRDPSNTEVALAQAEVSEQWTLGFQGLQVL